ncbi:proliferation marker protein Ki-67 [Plectropomus leopardus]|uniref:proliferation marker protein Ki-67 n=1 Tax=Plectropomus leopardus TaxID=160734 RepID=UPI001C4ABC6D|nr:proliferation marker protein Ki-67 [Plectropomus leopardus]
MPLHGKIVVIKRSGGDGTEFPLIATCLFGRRPDCDIRIQLPQVSKEHCRIELNENKEVILTNLSSVNQTRVNGVVLQQSERLKHGDVITIIDRSFRFEYPPAPTPKKRSSTGGKTETLKVLQDQQVGDTVTTETGDKRISEVPTDPHLKDGASHDNIQRSLEMEPKEDNGLQQSKTTSPFNDLYQMIKKSLDVKTPRKSSVSLLQTPASRYCTPRPGSVMKNDGKPVISTEDKSTPQKDEAKASLGADETRAAENTSEGTPKSVKKQRRSSQVPSNEMATPEVEAAKSEATLPQKRIRTPPQRFTACEVIEQITAQSPTSPLRRRSKEKKPAVTQEQEEQAATSPKTDRPRRASPRNSGSSVVEVEKVNKTSKKRKSGELADNLPAPQIKKKRVSFGGYLCPELFDKRLPPDSPLRKGASPRRSLCVSKPKQSLLRRASVIGLLQFNQEHPESPAKMRTPSPKKSSAKNASPKTPTPGKKSPKSSSPSPKATSPGKKSPKSRSPSPKATSPGKTSPKSRSSSPKAASSAKKSPKPRTPSPKAASPAKKSPKSKSLSPARGRSPAVGGTPGVQTPKVQGRFSVSRISTPSPNAEDTVTDKVPSSVTVTPKMPQKRKSVSQETSSVAKSAAKLMRRRSGISRASMKAKNSWADIVRFGQPKAQVAAVVKKAVTTKTKKKTVPKAQTPARKLKGHFSTGHADSPVTIVVGRAHKQRVVHPTGAAPRLVTNTALLKKNMKMDEDLTGISEMFKTPVNERKRRSAINENNTMKTPVGGLGTSVVEPSVLNTPEEPGEMIVSPLSVASTVKDRRYNSEAVQRLLNDDHESSFVSDAPTSEIPSDHSSEQQCTDLKMISVTTPKQKPELPECLTGVKRIMRTPRQKAEPVEDLRGRLLRTPKQKPKQQECLTGVKRIMKTPRQKAEPVEDLRGKILKTPKQKPEQQECLTGVKKMMETPKQEAEAVEDIRVELLTTPKQKPEQPECLTGVKSIFNTPQQEAEPLEEIQGKLLETPKALEAADASLEDAEELAKTPAKMQESEDLSEVADMKTPDVKSSPPLCLTGVKRIMKTPKERSAPVEDMVGVKRLMKTPREKGAPVEENFGIKRLVKTPRPSSNAPVEDFEGLQELMMEPLTEPSEQMETNEQVEDQTAPDCEEAVAKELDLAHEEPQDNVPSDAIDNVPQADTDEEEDAEKVVVDDHMEETQSGHIEHESSDVVSQAAEDEVMAVEQPKMDTADENSSKDQPEVDAVDEKESEDQPNVDEVDENIPEVDTTEDILPVEQPKEDAVDVNIPEVETATREVTEMDTSATDTDHEKKSVRGRRAKTAEPKAAEDKQEVAEYSEDIVSAPVRGRHGKKAEETAQPTIEAVPEEPVTEMTACKDAEMDADIAQKKTVRGRRAKTVEPKAAEDKQEVVEHAEDPVVPAPVRGRRGKKAEAAAPAAVRQTRGRNAKSEEINDEPTVEKSESLPSKVTLKAKRGRKADDKPETVQEVATETEMAAEHENEPSPPIDVSQEANDSAAPLKKAELKPKRGRRARQPEEPVPEQQDVPSTHSEDAPQADMAKEADANEVCSEQLEVVPTEDDENKSSDAMETVPPAPVTESSPEAGAATSTVTDMDAAIVPKKTVRGRRAKLAEPKSAEDKQGAEEHSEDPVVPAPVRGRRGKKTETAVRQTARGRNAKSQESASEDQPEIAPEKAEETMLVPETSTEAVSDHTSPINENDSERPAEEAVVKPVRGRKTKQTHSEPPQPEPEKTAVVSDEPVTADAQPAKPRRGRNAEPREAKTDTEQNEGVEEAVAAVETKQQSQPPVRAKRGRNAKQEDEKLESTSVETTESQEPVNKVRRTRKAEQDNVEPREEAETVTHL